MMKKFYFLIAIILLTPALAFSVPKGAVLLSPSDSYQTDDGSKTYTCAYLNDKYLAGKFLKKNPEYFLSYQADLRNKKKARKRASGSKALKLSKKIKKLKKLKRAGNNACSDARGGDGDTGGGTNFDAQGNVTAAGYALFQIPTNLPANIFTGQTVYNNKCVGCHIERTNRTFTNLREETRQAPMYYDENTLTDPDLANLTAYLNRFRFN